MKASEATKIADKIREEREKERAIREVERRKKLAKAEKEAREKFSKEFSEDADKAIAEDAAKGKKSTLLYVGYSDQSSGAAADYFENHAYVDIINKVIARLKRDGFKVERNIQTSEYYTNYEAGDTATGYRANYKVSWE